MRRTEGDEVAVRQGMAGIPSINPLPVDVCSAPAPKIANAELPTRTALSADNLGVYFGHFVGTQIHGIVDLIVNNDICRFFEGGGRASKDNFLHAQPYDANGRWPGANEVCTLGQCIQYRDNPLKPLGVVRSHHHGKAAQS